MPKEEERDSILRHTLNFYSSLCFVSIFEDLWSNLFFRATLKIIEFTFACSPTKSAWLGSTPLNGTATLPLCPTLTEKALWFWLPNPAARPSLPWSKSKLGLRSRVTSCLLKFYEVTVPWLEPKLWPLLGWNQATTTPSWLYHPFACMTMDMEVRIGLLNYSLNSSQFFSIL